MAEGFHKDPADRSSVLNRVLVVDDEEVIRDLIEMVLGSSGYEIVCCPTGTEALARCRGEDFGAIICDYGLGDMDGITFHRTLSQERNPLAGRMMLVTGEVVDDMVDTFLQETGIPSLRKPFDMAALEEMVQQIMNRDQRHGVPDPH